MNLGGALALGDATWINPNAPPVRPPRQHGTSSLSICEAAAAAAARNSPAAPGLAESCRKANAAASGAHSRAHNPASENGGCGPEPPRKAANASGSAQFVDGHVGNAWLACLDRVSAEKDARAAARAAPPEAPPPAPSPNLVPADPAVPGAVPQSSVAPSSLPPAVSSGGGGGASADWQAPEPVSAAAPKKQQTQQQQTPAASSPAGTSTGLIVGAVALATAAGVGLYLALR